MFQIALFTQKSFTCLNTIITCHIRFHIPKTISLFQNPHRARQEASYTSKHKAVFKKLSFEVLIFSYRTIVYHVLNCPFIYQLSFTALCSLHTYSFLLLRLSLGINTEKRRSKNSHVSEAHSSVNDSR